MASLTWAVSDSTSMSSLVEMCFTFRPGARDEYDKETKNLMEELQHLLQNNKGIGPNNDSKLSASQPPSVTPSGPGPPNAKINRTKSVPIQTMVNTILTKDAFSEAYIGAMRSDIKTLNDAPAVKRLQNYRGSHLKKAGGKSTRTARPDPTTMTEMTPISLAGGPLTVSTTDGSIKRFNILPPIETTEPVVYDTTSQSDADTLPGTRPGDRSGDPDYDDPAKYSWHVGSVDKWPNDSGNPLTISNVKPSDPSLKTFPKQEQQSSSLLGAKSTACSSARPTLQNKPTIPTLSDGAAAAAAAGLAATGSNSYVAMSVMTSGQEELKRHLKQRQKQRVSDQRDFQAESVNGKPLNSSGTYFIKYGDVEVPTTDVELYAILSVEKHNSPFSVEYANDEPQPGQKAIPEKMAEKLDYLVEKDNMETEGEAAASDERKCTADMPNNIEAAGESPETVPAMPQTGKSQAQPAEVSESAEIALPHVYPYKPNNSKPAHKVGQFITPDSRPKRRMKQGTVYKCYDTTKPSSKLRQAEQTPIILKPLVSTVLPEPGKSSNKETGAVQDDKRASNADFADLNDGSARAERRNISVTLPIMTRDEEDGFSQGDSHEEGCGQPDNESLPRVNTTGVGPLNRQPFLPPTVVLGDTTSQPSSAACSRSSSTTSKPGGRSTSSSHSQRSQPEATTHRGDQSAKPAPEETVAAGVLTVTGVNKPTPNAGLNANTSHPMPIALADCSVASNSSQESPLRRVAPPRLGVPLRRGSNADRMDCSSVSLMSSSSETLNSQASSAKRRPTESPASGLQGLSLNAGDRVGSLSKNTTTGSLPQLHHSGVLTSPTDSRPLMISMKETAKSYTALPSFPTQTSPESNLLIKNSQNTPTGSKPITLSTATKLQKL